MNDRSQARLYVDQPLASKILVSLEQEQTHYLRNVLRIVVGDHVSIFNGKDGEWLATIQEMGKSRCQLSLVEQRREQVSEPDLWLIFAPIKRAHLDFMIEKASELGVSRLLPVITRHTDVSRTNTERMVAIATEAAEQCERLSIPLVSEPAKLEQILSQWPQDRRLIVGAESGPAQNIGAVLGGLKGKPAAVLIGPEGGFSPEELELLRRCPFAIMAGLGPRILRADTAAISALACWQSTCGDWNDGTSIRPPYRD